MGTYQSLVYYCAMGPLCTTAPRGGRVVSQYLRMHFYFWGGGGQVVRRHPSEPSGSLTPAPGSTEWVPAHEELVPMCSSAVSHATNTGLDVR